MSFLLLIAMAVAAGWYARRKLILLVPLLAVAVYALVLFTTGLGRDTPVVMLALVAEICVAGGMFARKWTAASIPRT
ncbi:MAG: hypothetical protein ABI811_17405 [Acidobacteriota bacterium]